MFLRITGHTPVVIGAPGEEVTPRIKFGHSGDIPINLTVRVIGVEDEEGARPVGGGPFHGDQEYELDIPIVVPNNYGAGQHRVALEISSDSPGQQPVLTDVTISVRSADRVVLTTGPGIARGFRRAQINLEIHNDEDAVVDLTMSGYGGEGDVGIDFSTTNTIRIEPTQRRSERVTLRTPLRWSGDPVQHIVTLTATRDAAQTSMNARFIQRSVFPWRLRMFVAALTIVALFVASAFIVVDRGFSTDDSADPSATVDMTESDAEKTNGANDADEGVGGSSGNDRTGGSDSGGPASSSDADVGGSGDGADGGGVDGGVDGGGVDDEGRPDDGQTSSGGAGDATSPDSRSVDGDTRETLTRFRGTVTLADGDDGVGVTVSVTPIPLQEQAAALGRASNVQPERRPAKMWSARLSVSAPSSIGSTRATTTIASQIGTSRGGGVWLIPGVALRQDYEVSFAKDGYTTQRLFISPPDTGDSVELDIELEPGDGSITGSVADTNGKPLEGVELVATDGTVRIATKSDNDGAFELNALSLPSVYTVTATLDGYGTEIARFPLFVGADTTFVRPIEMKSDVGSIEGRITNRRGSGVGGALIVATIGDDEYRTTSLTAGTEGKYVLPRLPLSEFETYTVVVSAPGFTSQSKSVDVNGAEDNVSFSLGSSTGGLARLVISSDLTEPRGIGGALVTVRRSSQPLPKVSDRAMGGVQDGSSYILRTDSTGDLGHFFVDELPPGRYAVTVEHYQHETFSTFVTVKAGQPAPRSTIVLQKKPQAGDVTADRVTIRAIDRDNRQTVIRGVEFTLVPVVPSDSDPLPPSTSSPLPADERLATIYNEVPVGTYRVTAVHPEFRTEDVRRSVGPRDSTITLEMRRKGPVEITVVDAAAGPDAVPILCDARCPNFTLSRGGAPPILGSVGADSIWRSLMGVDLSFGTWTITVDQDPAGFFIPDQMVDGGGNMTFVIDRDSPSTIEVQLSAVTYPTVRATIYEPVNGGVDVARLNQPSVNITAACPNPNGGPLLESDVATGGPTGEFELSREVVQSLSDQLIEADPILPDPEDPRNEPVLEQCYLSVLVDGFTDRQIDFEPPLQLGSRDAYSDRYLNMVVLPETPSVEGRVFWQQLDANGSTVEVDLPGALITASGIVTGYRENQAINTSALAEPGVLRDQVSIQAGDDATFIVDQQVFGTATYTVDANGLGLGSFGMGMFQVAVPPSPQLVTAVSGVADPIIKNGEVHDIRLTSPEPGTFAGCIDIVSLDPDPFSVVDAVSVRAPGGTAETVQPVLQPSPGCSGTAFSIDGAIAGGWEFAFGRPYNNDDVGDDLYNYDLYVGPLNPQPPNSPQPPNPQTPTMPPGGSVTVPTATFVEAATVSLTVGDGVGALSSNATATITGGLLEAESLDRELNEAARIDRIPVSLSAPDPTAEFVEYSLALAVADYDTSKATITVNEVPIDVDGVPTSESGRPATADATNIVFSVAAGSEVDISVTLPEFGSLDATIDAALWSGPPVRREASVQSPSELGVRGRLIDPAGIVAPGPWVTFERLEGVGEFRLQEAEGFYEIEITHPEYDVGASPPSDGPDALSTVVYEITNEIPNPLAFDIVPKRGTLSLTVLGSANGPGVGEVSVRLYHKTDDTFTGDDPIVLRGAPAVTFASGDFEYSELFDRTAATLPLTEQELAVAFTAAGTGVIELPGLVPGTYWLQLSKVSAGQDVAYPVTATITIPQDASAGIRRVEITAFMPAVNSTIDVQIRVVNQGGEIAPFPNSNYVPVPLSIDVRRTFVGPSPLVGAAPASTILNLEFDDQTLAASPRPNDVPLPVPNPAPLTGLVSFENVAAGIHRLEPVMPSGYTIRPESDSLSVLTETGATRTVTLYYEVPDGEIVLDPVDGNGSIIDAPGLTATLSYAGQLFRGPISPVAGQITFENVPPRTLPYTVTVQSDLHRSTAPIDVLPGMAIVITASPNAARITGDVDLSNTPDGPLIDLPSGATFLVFDPGGNDITAEAVSRPGTGSYSFTVPAERITGDREFEIRVTYTSAFTTERHFVTVTTGRVSPNENIELRRKPNVLVVLDNPPAGSSVEIANSEIAGAEGPAGTWTFVVLPDVDYQFIVRGDPGDVYYYPITTSGQSFAYGLPDKEVLPPPPAVSFDLETRSVAVEVTTSNGSAATANVSLSIDGSPDATLESGPLGVPFTADFGLPATSEPLRIVGAAQVSAAAPGYRTNTGTSPDFQRSATIEVELRPLVSVSGMLSNAPIGTEITARFGNTTFDTATTDANGSFDFGPDGTFFDSGLWTMNAEVLGWGAMAEQTFRVTATDVVDASAGVNATPDVVTVAAALAPRAINVAPIVQRPSGVSLSGWTLDPASLVEAGTLTYSVNVVHVGSLSGSVGFILTAANVVNGSIMVVPGAPVELYEAPVIAGTASVDTGNLDGAVARLREGACAVNGSIVEGTDLVGEAFTFPTTASAVTVGAHCIEVIHTQGQTERNGRVNVVVANNPIGPATVTLSVPVISDTITVTLTI